MRLHCRDLALSSADYTVVGVDDRDERADETAYDRRLGKVMRAQLNESPNTLYAKSVAA